MAIQFNPDVVSASLKQVESTKKAKSPQGNSPGKSTAPATPVKYSLMEFYNLHGIMQTSRDRSGTLLDSYLETKKVIDEQLALLADVFKAPQMGMDQTAALAGVPEYWNKENTAQRIFSIALMRYEEGSDREQFADKAIAMVEQAYSDVRSMLGFEFPELVTDTRQTVLDALEQFMGGAALSEISFG